MPGAVDVSMAWRRRFRSLLFASDWASNEISGRSVDVVTMQETACLPCESRRNMVTFIRH